MGEVLIDTDGKVVQGWTMRREPVTPALRAFDSTMVDAVFPWEVEPLVLDGKAAPACVSLVRFVN